MTEQETRDFNRVCGLEYASKAWADACRSEARRQRRTFTVEVLEAGQWREVYRTDWLPDARRAFAVVCDHRGLSRREARYGEV